jgi:hypothetical protein
MINDCKVWGESPLPDCPSGGGFCTNPMRGGFSINTMIDGSKPMHPIPPKRIPYDKPASDASWYGKFIYNNNQLLNFTASNNAKAFILHANSPDYMHSHSFLNTRFINVEHDALAHFGDPPAGWAVLDNCGNFPCTAPWNAFLDFRATSFQGFTNVLAPPNFSLIPDNPGFSPFVEGCEFTASWNGWMCTRNTLGQLQFESLDPDKMDRSSQPIYVTLDVENGRMNNKLNAFMDHLWDGFYTS